MNEANLGGLLAEATSAKEEIILSNETTAVTTSTAIQILVQYTKYQKNLPSTRTGTVFTRMSVVKARHVFYSKRLDSKLTSSNQ